MQTDSLSRGWSLRRTGSHGGVALGGGALEYRRHDRDCDVAL